MKPIRLGIIGCGNVLDAYAPQCERLRAAGLAELVVACGREPQRERAAALGVSRFTTSEADVIGSPGIDVVVILASMPQHGRLARAALEAGQHVLIEKPLATSLAEAGELMALAQQRERNLVCAPFTILSPTFQAIARRLRGGEIGSPCLARARYGWSGPWWSEWFYRPGGGALFDLGVYSLTTLTGLLGPARRVTAFTGVAIPEREVNGRRITVEAEDNAQVLLDFGRACFGVVTCGFTMQQYRSPALEIYGSQGVIQMLGDDWDPDGYELWRNDAGCWQVFKETAPEWPWTDGLRHLVECLHAGATPQVTASHARHVLEIMLKAQQSAREGRTLDLETSFSLPPLAGAGPEEAAHRQHDRTRTHVEPQPGKGR
jgi:predicted dehydrogenase